MMIICICMPKRRSAMKRQFEKMGLEYILFDAVESLEDPRVLPMLLKNDKTSSYLCTLSHQLCMQIASERSEPTIIMEDDVALHKNFVAVASELMKHAWDCVSLGYLVRHDEFLRDLMVDPVAVSSHFLGRSKSKYLWGTQCYIVRQSYAKKIWSERFNVKGTCDPETMMFDEHRHVLSPPLAIEDFPTFGSILGHNATNAQCDTNMKKQIKRDDYFAFPDSNWEKYVTPLNPKTFLMLGSNNDIKNWMEATEEEINDLVYIANPISAQKLFLDLAEAYKRTRQYGMIVIDAAQGIVNAPKQLFLQLFNNNEIMIVDYHIPTLFLIKMC